MFSVQSADCSGGNAKAEEKEKRGVEIRGG